MWRAVFEHEEVVIRPEEVQRLLQPGASGVIAADRDHNVRAPVGGADPGGRTSSSSSSRGGEHPREDSRPLPPIVCHPRVNAAAAAAAAIGDHPASNARRDGAEGHHTVEENVGQWRRR